MLIAAAAKDERNSLSRAVGIVWHRAYQKVLHGMPIGRMQHHFHIPIVHTSCKYYIKRHKAAIFSTRACITGSSLVAKSSSSSSSASSSSSSGWCWLATVSGMFDRQRSDDTWHRGRAGWRMMEYQFLRESYVKKYLRDISLGVREISLGVREISLKKTKNNCTGDCSTNNYLWNPRLCNFTW